MEKILKQTVIETRNLSFGYSDVKVLRNINLMLREGEILGIAGESGSGKTSLLKLLAGLLEPGSGGILFNGEKLQPPSQKLIPGHDRISIIQQDFDLMPYISVDENIYREGHTLTKGLSGRKVAEIRAKLKLSKFKANKAGQTSGGQKQRVAIARAIAAKPEVLLLDEPFSNLDHGLKADLIQLLKSEWKARAMILVTHEPNDLLQVADRIVVLENGRIVQQGSPQHLYSFPKNRYVCQFIRRG